MPTIQISDETMKRLKAWAEPLEDTADSALAKVLDVAEQHHLHRDEKESSHIQRARKSNRRRPKTPLEAFRRPLLEVIYKQGGSARRSDLYQPMKERMQSRLIPGDFDRDTSGEERWWKSVDWMRYHLVQNGYLKKDSYGIWALTEKGIRWIESVSSETSQSFADHLRAMPDAGEDSDFDRSPS